MQVAIYSTQLFNQLRKAMGMSKTKNLKAEDFLLQHYFEIVRFPLIPKWKDLSLITCHRKFQSSERAKFHTSLQGQNQLSLDVAM